MKWFEEVNLARPAVICSRVRLVRNLEDYAFPSRLTEKQAGEMITQLETGLRELGALDGRHYEQARLRELSELDRRALRERRVFNSTIASKKEPAGVMVSDDEKVGIVLNGTDHIRIQLFASGLHLDDLWNQASQIDDYINERFSYAFDEKYGYLTSFPTSVGTGLRASVVLHLPLLSQSKRFNGMVTEMTRFGASVKGMYGEGEENCGALFEVSNQKTLGMTEKEILDMVSKVALQLTARRNRCASLRSIKTVPPGRMTLTAPMAF
ncbi:ATP--guanido phosphotransferase [Clostridium sp. OF09-36]|uniref:ATP--guanido phosphotransferase n=1 Tax=Clostridium sp. OF09-36 TaxID=2292310 RepID=UPI00325A7902